MPGGIFDSPFCCTELVWGTLKRRITNEVTRLHRRHGQPEYQFRQVVMEMQESYDNDVDGSNVANHVLVNMRRVMEHELI